MEFGFNRFTHVYYVLVCPITKVGALREADVRPSGHPPVCLSVCLSRVLAQQRYVFSERELMFTFAICCCPSVWRLSGVSLSVCR